MLKMREEKMKFAFIIMGSFDSNEDCALIHNGLAQIIGVADIEEACKVAKRLLSEGIGCIELCGAFDKEGTKRVIQAIDNKIPVGYVTHLPEQEEVYRKAFLR